MSALKGKDNPIHSVVPDADMREALKNLNRGLEQDVPNLFSGAKIKDPTAGQLWAQRLRGERPVASLYPGVSKENVRDITRHGTGVNKKITWGRGGLAGTLIGGAGLGAAAGGFVAPFAHNRLPSWVPGVSDENAYTAFKPIEKGYNLLTADPYGTADQRRILEMIRKMDPALAGGQP
jgi:hypothetical protein